MAWCGLDDKPLSEPMMVSLLMHTCITRLQWVNVQKCCEITQDLVGSYDNQNHYQSLNSQRHFEKCSSWNTVFLLLLLLIWICSHQCVYWSPSAILFAYYRHRTEHILSCSCTGMTFGRIKRHLKSLWLSNAKDLDQQQLRQWLAGHYLNHCWTPKSLGLSCHSPKGNSIGNAHESNHYNALDNYTFKIKSASPRGHRINSWVCAQNNTKGWWFLEVFEVQNHWQVVCSLSSLFSLTREKLWNLSIPSQSASNAESISMPQCHPDDITQQNTNCVHLSLISPLYYDVPGPLFTKKIRRRRLTGIGIPIINLRRSDDRLRFIMGIPILIRWRLLVNRGPVFPGKLPLMYSCGGLLIHTDACSHLSPFVIWHSASFEGMNPEQRWPMVAEEIFSWNFFMKTTCFD